jgi:hypothetical protein
MKTLILLLFLVAGNALYGSIKLDTIANWQIYYDSELITSGNEYAHRVPDTGVLKLGEERKNLVIHYGYDFDKPEWREITIKSGDEIIYSAKEELKDNHPAKIDLSKIRQIGEGKFKEIQVYYSDDITSEKNRLIGKINLIYL